MRAAIQASSSLLSIPLRGTSSTSRSELAREEAWCQAWVYRPIFGIICVHKVDVNQISRNKFLSLFIMHVSLRLVNRLKTVIVIIGMLVLHPNIPKQNDSVTKYIIFFNIMILKPNLNIGFYFIKNGSLTCNVFGHVKLNLKLSLFQNLDLEYSIFPIVVPRSELSIILFCKIPKSKILTKKKALVARR